MDKTDMALIAALQADGRASYGTLACRLRLSESTVRRRVSRLFKDKTIVATVIPDLFKIGLRCYALIGINVELRHVESVMEKLAKDDLVFMLGSTTGRFDVVLSVYCRSQEELNTFITERLSTIEGILRTETFIFMKLRKWRHQLAP